MNGIMWINPVLGVWLVVAPFAMASASVLTAHDVALGILLVAGSCGCSPRWRCR